MRRHEPSILNFLFRMSFSCCIKSVSPSFSVTVALFVIRGRGKLRIILLQFSLYNSGIQSIGNRIHNSSRRIRCPRYSIHVQRLLIHDIVQDCSGTFKKFGSFLFLYNVNSSNCPEFYRNFNLNNIFITFRFPLIGSIF